VSDAGLVSLHELKNLTHIMLSDTEVTGEGVEKLQEALPKCTIKY